MKKTLIALSLFALSAAASAQAPSFLSNGEYKVFTGYNKTSEKAGDLKQTANSGEIGARADMSFDEHHGMRLEAGYRFGKKDSTDTTEGAKFSKGAKDQKVDVYAGYTYTQQLSEGARLRAGVGLGYENANDKVHKKLVDGASGFDVGREAFYAKAHVEIRQDLGSGWAVTPWGEAVVDLHAKTKAKTTQIGASNDVSKKTNGWGVGLGVNVEKQLSDSVGVEFGPYYKHRHFGESAKFVQDGEETYIDKARINEYGMRVGLKF